MTMIPIWKKCPKCHKKYGWNPDVGVMTCPYCHGLGEEKTGILENLFSKKEKDKDNKK